MNEIASPAGETIRVWLIEDDADFRQTISFLLDNTTGVQCGRTFDRGEEALAALDDAAADAWPHVVLLDINLPGRSGLDCIADLKARQPEVRIVMMTIRDEKETILEAFCAGASGYLLKNAPVEKIIAAVRESYEGGMLMPAPVAREVLSFLRGETPQQADYGLTHRQKEVLQEMVDGLSQKQIADQLFISRATVSTHIQHIYEKLHVHSGPAAVAKALRERLL